MAEACFQEENDVLKERMRFEIDSHLEKVCKEPRTQRKQAKQKTNFEDAQLCTIAQRK